VLITFPKCNQNINMKEDFTMTSVTSLITFFVTIKSVSILLSGGLYLHCLVKQEHVRTKSEVGAPFTGDAYAAERSNVAPLY
jgi:hypothetical protein